MYDKALKGALGNKKVPERGGNFVFFLIRHQTNRSLDIVVWERDVFIIRVVSDMQDDIVQYNVRRKILGCRCELLVDG